MSIIITTRGFNAPHTNAVAILRPTENARQMTGRAIRLYDGKEKAYLWDYAETWQGLQKNQELYSSLTFKRLEKKHPLSIRSFAQIAAM